MTLSDHGAMRSHGAGTLTADDAGTTVELAGWVDTRRDHGGKAFLDLRDRSGLVQVVAEDGDALEAFHDVRPEWVVAVTGTVRERPEGTVNPDLATGGVEVAAASVEVLSRAETPPFPVEDGVEADETIRLRHRYVDLRRPEMARILRQRSRANAVARRVMERHGFTEVETPILTRPTPEGARDFLVPSRLRPGHTYALPQSPQLFKQLLQVAGVERYYQLCRVFRDEDLRADRQQEFTQLDFELSFGDREDVLALTEELLAELWSEVLDVDVDTPFDRIPHDEAMRRFGTDKPDLRFGLELARLDDVFADTGVGVFKGVLEGGGSVIALALPGGGDLSRSAFDGWIDWARERGAKGLAWAVVEQEPTDDAASDDVLRSPLARHMSTDEVAGILRETGAEVGDAVFFGAGEPDFARDLMGRLRVALAEDRDLIDRDAHDFLWITEPPLFEPVEDPAATAGHGDWGPVHHPFTRPTDEWVDDFEDAPGEARAQAYDVVCNGYEIGGGSMRIHEGPLQQRVFEFLGIDAEEAADKFGFLLRGLSYGAPPHGGIALGWDRVCMILAGRDSIRDVIAFPKTQSGSEPMTGAPTPADPEALDEVGLQLAPGVLEEDDDGE